MATNDDQDNQHTTDDTNTTTTAADNYRFALEDKERWLAHLRETGYVVIAHALSKENVATAQDLLWTDLKNGHGVDPATSGFAWNFCPEHGIVPALAQTRGPWFVRGHAAVQDAFLAIWNLHEPSDLITSMDAVLMWPADRCPRTEGLHLDQNPFRKPHLDCVQGMVPLLDVTKATGGLEVVPRTHLPNAQARQREDNPHWEYMGDFCTVFDTTPYKDTRRLLTCDAGDLILWDSRVVHGGVEGDGPYNGTGLARLSVTVAMTPREWASDDVQNERRQGFAHGESFNHCPHETSRSNRRRKKGYQPVGELTLRQKAVL